MNLRAVLWGALALVSASVPLAGQEADAAVIVQARTSSGPLTPSQLVADRVRRVLADEADSGAWRELASTLPELAVSGEADIATVFEAARVAEEIGLAENAASAVESASSIDAAQVPVAALALVAAPVSPAGDAARVWLSEAGDRFASWLGTAGRSLIPTNASEALETLVLLMVVLMLALMIKGGRRERASAAPQRSTSEPKRLRDVRSLTSKGMPTHEIARRTGLARDAVAILSRRSR